MSLEEEFKELQKIAESQELTIGEYLKQEAEKILTKK